MDTKWVDKLIPSARLLSNGQTIGYIMAYEGEELAFSFSLDGLREIGHSFVDYHEYTELTEYEVVTWGKKYAFVSREIAFIEEEEDTLLEIRTNGTVLVRGHICNTYDFVSLDEFDFITRKITELEQYRQ